MNCYYFRKNNYIFFILSILIFVNGFWVFKENFATNAYKTYIINKFYNDLYKKSQSKPIKVYIDKTPYDEDDTTILFRMKEYGVKYSLSNFADKTYQKIKTNSTITDSYSIKY